MELHTTTQVEAIAASGHGALAGFESRCESCGLVIRSSLRTIVERDVWEHVAYFAAKAAGPKALTAFFRGDLSAGLRQVCGVCGSDERATIHQPEPERGCKRPDEHHEFVEDEEAIE